MLPSMRKSSGQAADRIAVRRPEQRKHVHLAETSARMRSIGQRDTAPELALRRLLHREGIRFRLCAADLPGRPDLSNKSARWCVFAHGCFWHGHPRCKLARLPRTNSAWWEAKISA